MPSALAILSAMSHFHQLRQHIQSNPNYPNQIRQWRVIVMAISAFIFNTTEFVPIALLSDIGHSFAMPVETVGHMITIYAWIVAILSLPAMLATARIERRKLLIVLFVIFIGGHAVSVMAQSFAMLLAGRALIALAHAVFWSITASLVVRVAPKDRQTKALGLLSMGSALATVLGLPLGRMVGQWLGWRMTFGTIGATALLAMIMVWWILPKLPSKDVGSAASLPSIFNNIPLLTVYTLTVLCVTAHFTAYSYIEPYMLTISQFSQQFATVILLGFGVAGLLASWLFGHFYDRFPRAFLISAMATLLFSLLASAWLPHVPILWLVLAMLWGLAITAISLALQLRVLQLAPNATDVAMSIFSGIYNIGIGGGAFVGGWVIASLGLAMVGYVGAGIALIAMVCLMVYLARTQK
ncbi:sugar transporter [Moraxella osloensis]|uniref:Sugar transporter n=1 Tax=Faucicola osloensis TaxID=34062 RepID=A0A2I5HS87_FAUOS|nr:sugar transporter [Moraxella osloensis]ATW71356.1 sugar transporter [Moraxella osloensis]